MNNNVLLWIWLKVCTGDRNLDTYKLYTHFGSVEKIFSLTTDEIGEIDIVSDNVKSELFKKDTRAAQRIIRNCESNNIEIITIDDKRYPQALLHIYNPPCVLFAHGNVEKAFSKPLLTIVGTRECNSYGERSGSKISAVAAYAGFTVVAGVADGIDTAVISGALGVGGSVIAILPTGHAGISLGDSYKFKDVRKDGVILSEHLPSSSSHQFAYQERNRILAGISIASVIIQAPKKSGALMTADYAIKQNKDVFSLPANIDMPQSEGCNNLINDGAIPILNYKTVVDYFKPKYDGVINDNIPEHLLELPKLDESGEAKTYEFKRIVEKHLDDDERIVLAAIQSGKNDVDSIIEKTTIPYNYVACALTSLVQKNIIRGIPGNKYEIII